MTWHLIWLWAAQTLVSGLAGVGLIGAVLAAFGRGWITHFFDRRIERVRAAQQQEIEQLKTKLGRLQDRGVRSNEREYDALITAWEKFVDAYIATTNCIMSFIQHPDLNLMQADEVDEYLKEPPF